MNKVSGSLFYWRIVLKIINTWIPLDGTSDEEFSDSWKCPDCNWLLIIELDTPVEYGYNFCPKCGKRRIDYEY